LTEPVEVKFDIEWISNRIGFVYAYADAKYVTWLHIYCENTWKMISDYSYWREIQSSELIASLWLLAMIRSYESFLVFYTNYEHQFNNDIVSVLKNNFDFEEISKELSSDERFDSGDSSLSVESLLLDEFEKVVSKFSDFLYENLGSPEIIISFYTDPFGWRNRLNGMLFSDSMRALFPSSEFLEFKYGEVVEATVRLFEAKK